MQADLLEIENLCSAHKKKPGLLLYDTLKSIIIAPGVIK
jgi:hypothetical protein